MSFDSDLKALRASFACRVESCDGYGKLFGIGCAHWDYDDEADYRDEKSSLKRAYAAVAA